jgi:dUTP pyrophosphatase
MDELAILRLRVDRLESDLAPWRTIYTTPPEEHSRIRVVNKSGHPFARASTGSIGFDLHAVIGTPRNILGGTRWTFDTGIALELPQGMGAMVQPRSGLAKHHGLVAVTGVIDRDYRGFLGVTLVNTTANAIQVLPGDRIAQLVFVHVPSTIDVEQAEELADLTSTDRNASGFGSTGR